MEINQQLLWVPAPSGSRAGEAPGRSWGTSHPRSANDTSALTKSSNVQWSPAGLQMHGDEGPGPRQGGKKGLGDGDS